MQREPVEIHVDNEKIRGILYIPESNSKKVGVLLIHGWTGKPNHAAAEILAKNGYKVLAISLRGHNDSDGDIRRVSRKKSLDDAIAAYDYLNSALRPSSPIAVVGSSYGSYIAVMLSAKRVVSALSLRVPATYPDEGFDDAQWGMGGENPRINAWRKTTVSFDKNTAFKNLHNFNGQVQIIEAGQDEQVPSEAIKNYIDAINSKSKLEYHLMKDWPHSLGDNIENNRHFQVILLSWLNNIVK